LQGELELFFRANEGQTWLDRYFATVPLQVQRSFYPEGKQCCHTIILHLGGGIVAGDRLSIKCVLDQQASVLITSPTATKVYRSVESFAMQEITIHLRENSILEWLPQETILFADAKLRQKLLIKLAENALCYGWEITRFGRTARQEKFNQGIWKNHIEVWQNDQPLWIDRQFITGDMVEDYNGLWQKSVIGTLWFIGQGVNPETIDALRSLLQPCPDEIYVTRLQKGLVCRYRGNSSVLCRQYFILVWHYLRNSYSHYPPYIPRIWL